uniref:Uncharacterized protein n=1 Tax=Salix viminalis TaxID=40686 RepID=A0A6N2MWM0_SALVM
MADLWTALHSYVPLASCTVTNYLMASKSHFYLNTLFILLLSIFCLESSSSSLSDTETDYMRWVSWNVHNHQNRAMLMAKSTIQAPGAGGKLVLDDKLLAS